MSKKIRATDRQCNKAQELLTAFLEGMPELTIDKDKNPAEYNIVQECYSGDVIRYIEESFGNFIDQVVDE
jgi:hypothetical protein